MKRKTNIYVCYVSYKSQRAEGRGLQNQSFQESTRDNLPSIKKVESREFCQRRESPQNRKKQNKTKHTHLKVSLFFKYFSFSSFLALLNFPLLAFLIKMAQSFKTLQNDLAYLLYFLKFNHNTFRSRNVNLTLFIEVFQCYPCRKLY